MGLHRDLSLGWIRSGVQKDEILLVHSSIKSTCQIWGCTPHDIIKSFLIALGTNGTLLLPTFNFDFAKGVPFDIRNTPSHMGALSEAGRSYPGATRTGHPFYSFCAIGARAKEFEKINNYSGYGGDSPFAWVDRIATLDVADENCMTFYHHIEEMHNVPWRFHKNFNGEYIDKEGVSRKKAYNLFVRKDGVITDVKGMGELSWWSDICDGNRPFIGSGLKTVSAKELYRLTSQIITEGKAEGILYRYEK